MMKGLVLVCGDDFHSNKILRQGKDDVAKSQRNVRMLEIRIRNPCPPNEEQMKNS